MKEHHDVQEYKQKKSFLHRLRAVWEEIVTWKYYIPKYYIPT